MHEPNTDTANRRQHYRVEYPAADRPAFSAGAVCGFVTDCSETGVRVLVDPLAPDVALAMGDRMGATIRFMRGEMADVAGEVVRWDGQTLVLKLDRQRIPFGKIIREQWWLRSRYPFREQE